MISIDDLFKVVSQKKVLVPLVAVFSAAGGAAAGFVVATKKLEEKYVALSEQEIAEAKEYYAKFYKTDEYSDPSALADSLGVSEINTASEAEATEDEALLLAEALVEIQKREGKTASNRVNYDQIEPNPNAVQKKTQSFEILSANLDRLPAEGETVVEVIANVFTNADTSKTNGWDIEAELDKRRNGVPYIISEAEYIENETGYEQGNYTYFSEDNTLCDSHDVMIPDSDAAVGDANLQHFGHGSNDPNIVYIRNEQLETEFEISFNESSYAQEVAGFTHSDTSDRRRTRRHSWSADE